MIIDAIPDRTDPSHGTVIWQQGGGREVRVPCRLGKRGVIAAADKREGDGCTPAGTWRLRRVHLRTDRIPSITTAAVVRAIQPTDGWCDDVNDANYNTLVSLPFPASHETLHRDDGLYDVVVELGYNDDPPVAGNGSAIFMHVMSDDGKATEGCVALAKDDLLRLLKDTDTDTRIRIHLPAT